MHILRTAWFLAETGIEIGGELGRIGIDRLDRADAALAQFLHKPVLQRLIGAFDSAFGLRSVGADDVDVQLVERATELRQATRSILLRTMRRAKDAMLVAVEGDRLAPFLQIRLGGDQVVERVLGTSKAQMQQPARRVVDVNEQGAFRAVQALTESAGIPVWADL